VIAFAVAVAFLARFSQDRHLLTKH
jgi:hypothetical protein